MKSFQEDVHVQYLRDGASIHLDEPESEKPKYSPVDFSKAQGNIDGVAGYETKRIVTVSRKSQITRIEGWAANLVTHKPASDILFYVEKNLVGRTSCDAPYPGVSKLLGIDGCGFSTDINVESVPLGRHDLTMLIDVGHSHYYPAPNKVVLNVVP